jgi:hypothetical protein
MMNNGQKVQGHLSATNVRFRLQPALAWTAILSLILISAVCTLAAAKMMNLFFPAGCFAVGLLLYLRYPLLYISFTWWLWFLTPLIRRLVDYQSSFTEPSPILLSPLLVTFISGISFLKYFPQSIQRGGIPFILCFFSVFYSFLIGIIQNPIKGAVIDFLGWMAPLLFSFHLFVNWRKYPQYRQNTQRTFFWGVLVMGSYGVWQYLVAPEWDRFWLRNASVVSFGTPEPLGIRVWSTLNAPQAFAGVMVAGLLLLFSQKGSLRFPAAALGYLSFLLSLARSAWLSWIAGLLFFFPSLQSNLQMRLIITITIGLLFVIPLTTIEPFSTVINSRIESFSSTKTDGSYQDRTRGYNELIGLALSESMGKGLGYTIKHQSIGGRDSGILPLLFSFGWLGMIPYFGGILLLFFKILQSPEGKFDTFASVSRAIALGTFAQIPLNIVTTGIIGMVFWGFLGISIASHKYYLNKLNSDVVLGHL